MKKKLFGVAIVFTFAIIVTIGVKAGLNNNHSNLSLFLANIEAFASDDEIASGAACYNKTTYDSTMPEVVVCDSPCKRSPVVIDDTNSTSTCQ